MKSLRTQPDHSHSVPRDHSDGQAQSVQSADMISETEHPGGVRLVKSLVLAAGRILGWIPLWYKHRTEIHKLRVLSDLHMKDIGLDSFQIASSIEEKIEVERRSKYKAGTHIPYR